VPDVNYITTAKTRKLHGHNLDCYRTMAMNPVDNRPPGPGVPIMARATYIVPRSRGSPTYIVPRSRGSPSQNDAF